MTDLPDGYVMPPSTVPMPAQVPMRASQWSLVYVSPSMDFDAVPHEKLLEMIKGVDPDKTEAIGTKLHSASAKIKKVAEELKQYMDEDRVPWEGQGGDAFRAWGGKMVKATGELSEFSGVAGKWLLHAAETLHSVKKGMPPYPSEAKALLDSFKKSGGSGPELFRKQPASKPKNLVEIQPPTKEEADKAQAHVDKEHAEAAQLMRKLAGSYSNSTLYINNVKRPEFPPMPMKIMPPPVDKSKIEEVQDKPVAGGTGGGGDVHANHVRVTGGSGSVPLAHGHSSGISTGGGVLPVGHASTELAHAPTVAHNQVLPSGGATPPSPVSGHPHPTTPPPSPLVPPFNAGSPRAPRPSGTSETPPLGRTSRASERAGFNQIPSTRSPRNPVDGVVGARPSPTAKGSPVSRIPRGTVIGTEPIQGGAAMQGRPPMGQGPLTGGGSGLPSGGPGARRLASETGGVVGGSPQRPPGGGAGGTFTPGGSGLVRGNSSGTAGSRPGGGRVAPPSSQAKAEKPRSRRAGERPDYLVEDEETWRPDHGRVSPPVID
ncbi:hypothetical protein AB0I22_12280 [Streptomyces sp. NPDC050610]|uniref:WXG100 family type VII secretion target n=1 Tax=Streptomyces sp. NPDC050610 TaxID=3157097 RepID=UPI0034288217